MELNSLKQQVSEWINIEQNRLHEISLEDVIITEGVLLSIGKIVSQLMLLYRSDSLSFDPIENINDKIPCMGYWVENSKDLVIYISVDSQSRTIIIPQNGWMLRNDITIH